MEKIETDLFFKFMANRLDKMRFYCPISKIWLMACDRTKKAIHVAIVILVFFVVCRSRS